MTLANHMESGGVPGYVHISHETFNYLTGLEDYQVIEGNGSTRDSFLKERKVTTYLLKPKIEENCLLNFMSPAVGDTNKRSRYSKLDLWLKDNTTNNKVNDNDSDQANITYSLLEDSLSPLKCSLSSKCLFE